MQENKKESSRSKPKTTRKSYKKEYEKAAAENAQLKDQLLRKAAEFDNYRKRSLAEKAEFFNTAQASFAKDLLPVLDDLERVVLASEKHNDYEAILEGVKLAYKDFIKVMSAKGLKKMETIGKPFNPEKHDALLQQEKEGVDSDIVLDEHSSGYEWDDQVLRHAKVIVSK